jgi:hemolysin D
MSIRIESLPPESVDASVDAFIAPPETDTFFQNTFYNAQNFFHDDVRSESAYLYGGAIAADAAIPQPSFESPPTASDRSQATAPLVSKWSTSLQNVLDRPPPSLPNRLVAGGVLFCAAFTAWATTSQMEEVGRAQGRLIPQGEPYKVHPVVSGKIARVNVREGQTVKAGQVVAELDNELALNHIEGLRQEHASYDKELMQTDALINKTRLEAQTRATIADAEIRAQEAAISQAQAKIEGQDTTISQATEQVATRRELLSQLQSDAAAQKERLARLQYLVDEGALAREQLFQAQQNFGDRQRTITQQMGDIQQTFAESQRLRSDLQQVIAESRRLRAQLVQKYAEGQSAQIQAQQTIQQLLVQRTQLQAKIQQNEKQLEQAKAELKQLALTAPVDGVVLSLNVRNSGEVVQPGQTITEIAPQTAPLILVAALPTREAGFVKVGDKAQIKFDAYPYQDYGVSAGKVTTISPDIKVDERLGAIYRVEIALDRSSIATKSQATPLKAGQTATAEIVIRRRTIAEMLLDPLRQLQKGGINL